MLPKQYRLSPKDFQRVYKNGFKVKGTYGMLIGLKEKDLDTPKMGIVVNTKVGNSVVRHRTTRQIREVSSKLLSKHTSPILYEYVSFIPVEKTSDLEKELSEQFVQLEGRLR